MAQGGSARPGGGDGVRSRVTVDLNDSRIDAAQLYPGPPVWPGVGPEEFGRKFEVEGVIGSGGMGTVIKVRHKALGQVRAIKLLNAVREGVDTKAFERLRREAIIASDLSHPSVVRVFDFDVTAQGSPYIVMEHLEGTDLERLIAKRGRLGLDETVRILAGVANALDEVHRHGVTHRDLKPANIFVTNTGVTKILDFGISHADRSRLRLTNTGEVMGTPVYMAPEQLRGEGVGPWSDIYALAAVAQEMLTGEPAFMEDTPGLLVASVLEKPPRPANELVPELSQETVEALQRGLAKDPEERQGFALELIGEIAGNNIDALLDSGDLFITPSRLVQLQSGTHRRRKQKRARKLSLIGVVGILCAAALAAGLVVFGITGKQSPRPVEITGVQVSAGEDAEWSEAALAGVLEAYLMLDDHVEGVRPAGSGSAVGRDGAIGLSMKATRDGGRWWLDLELDEDGDGAGDWAFSGSDEGFEKVIEEGTWHLREEVTSRRFRPSTGEAWSGCALGDGACRKGLMARRALLEKGLFARVARLARDEAEGAQAQRWERIAALARCKATITERDCLETDTAPTGVSPDPLNRALDQIFDEKERAAGLASLCELAPTEPLARGVLGVLGDGHEECGNGRIARCRHLETFLDRLACMGDSALSDDAAVTRAYADRILEEDLANSVYAGSFAVISEGAEGEASWHDRMRYRYGNSDDLLAEGSFMRAMVTRDSTEALIWARRAEMSEWREGLALQLGGWLRSGVEKAARGAAALSSKGGGMTEREIQLVLRPALQPVILTGDRELAGLWLKAAAEVESQGAALQEGMEVVRALAGGDGCPKGGEDGGLFELERRYLCENWQGVVDLWRRETAEGYGKQVSRYYYAKALSKLGRSEDARQELEQIEGDPMVRTILPICALYAMESLAELDIEEGELQRACERLSALLEAWDGLDVPVESYLEARRSAQICRN